MLDDFGGYTAGFGKPYRPKPKEERPDHIINQIEEIRKQNNENWMNILRIAMREAPKETKGLMKLISDCDNQINELTRKLADI